MRVTLCTPPSCFLLDERVFPSLGILKVGAVLEKAGHTVEHLDLSGVTNFNEVIRDYATTSPSRTFALTATTPQMPATTQIAKQLRKLRPDARLLIGGPHPTLVNAAMKLQNSSGRALTAWQEMKDTYDVIVCGDGEKAIFPALESGLSVVDADDPHSPLWLTSKDFGESLWPARHLLDINTYHYYIEQERSLSLVGQLGCCFGCNFCAGRNSAMLRRIRTRPASGVVAEMSHLYETYGIKGCMFLDDELNVNKEMLPMLHGLKEAANRYGVNWRLRGFLKSELFTDEQAKAMYDAGFRQVLIGFEAGHDRILKNIQKNATRNDNTRAVEIAHRNGLKVKALMSVGHPGESEETILAIRDWLLEVHPSDFDVTCIQPYPGSGYYDRAEQIGQGVWCFTAPKTDDKLYMEDVDFTKEAQYYKGAVGSYVSYVWTDALSRERIVELRDQVEQEVRQRLNIPFYATGAALKYEHSMGAGFGQIPSHILRNGTAYARQASAS